MDDIQQPLLTPGDFARFIAEHGIDAQIVPVEVETPTVPAAAAALGVQVAQIIKTLLFLVRDSNPVVVIVSGDTIVDRRALADRYGVGKKQVKLADPQTVARITGYPVGGVPPFGHVVTAPVFLDKRIRLWDVVYGGGGDDHTLLRVPTVELARITQGEWIDLL